MALGQRIQQGRAKRGWNQKQLAEASRITQATISRLEADQVTPLKSDALGRLAEELGVTVDTWWAAREPPWRWAVLIQPCGNS